MNPIIELKHIDLAFEDKTVFKDFQLSIMPGEKLRIGGKSGNGKSTLLKILLGFQSVDDGDLLIEGKVIHGKDFKEIRQLFAYVNQDVTLRPGVVTDVLKDIATYSGNDFSGELDLELAKRFDFDLNLLQKNTDELSGGERQRLGIIIAIMLNRPIFLLDEITSALDSELKKKVVDYFKNCPETVIAISHDEEWSNLGRKVEWS